MGLDTKSYWLTDRQSQCNVDFDFVFETEAVTVGFRGNEYASSSCIGKREIEGFNRVFSLQSAKD
jgi:hypothetical protein